MATSENAGLRGRLIAGAIGGIVGTAAMTAAMRRLHRRLPARERYPLPPREITERATPRLGEDASADLTVANHFGFGAAAGALMTSARPPGVVGGSLWGVLVWLGSYFGWVPASGILRPASSHPARRNALMILVHLVWGSVAALTAREVLAARATSFGGGALGDAPGVGRE
jgi:hypothetical protein